MTLTVTPNLEAAVPQIPSADSCIAYAYSGSEARVKRSTRIVPTQGKPYQFGVYAKAFNATGTASCTISAAAYDDDIANVPDIVTDGLVCHLIAERADAGTDPGSGSLTDWQELTGSGDGTLTNFDFDAADGWGGTGAASDPYALRFDSTSSDYIVMPDGGVAENAAYSFEAWVRDTGSKVADWRIIYSESGVSPIRAQLGIYNGSFYMTTRDGTATAQIGTATSTYSGDGLWHHVVGTVDAASARVHIYVDGASGSNSVVAPRTGLVMDTATIGRASYGSVYYWNGYMSVLRLYSKALSLAEVQQNYAAGPTCPYPTVVRTEALGTFDANSDWDRHLASLTPGVGEDQMGLLMEWSGTGTLTLDVTGCSIVQEETPSAFFAGTRVDSGDLGDSDDAAPGLPHQIVADAGMWVRYGPHKLWEGWLSAPQQTYDSDERWYVPAGSYLERGKRAETFGRIYKDSDISQWQGMENVPSWATANNSGDKWRILNSAGNPVPTTDNGVVYPIAFYWLMSGLRTDVHIDSVTFTLTKVGTPLYTLGVCSWAVPPTPSASNTSEATYTSATADGSKTVTLTGTPQAVGFYVKSTNAAGWTATSDNGFDISGISITTSAGTLDLGVALADLAKLVGIDSGSALHTYTDTSVSTLVARPMTTISAAQDSLVALASKQLKWGYEVGGLFDSAEVALPDATAKGDRARWWSLSHVDCSYSSDVVTDGEGFVDYVTVLYAAIGVSGVTDGTVRSVTRGRSGAATASDTDRVRLLDYSGRYMSESEAQAIGDQYMLWQTASARGTIKLKGDVRDVDGHTRPGLFIRPGDWVEERDRRGHTPWLVTGVSYLATGEVAVSVGGQERVFPVINPGLSGIYVDDPLGTWTPEEADSGSTTTDESSAYSGPSLVSFTYEGDPAYADWTMVYDSYGSPKWMSPYYSKGDGLTAAEDAYGGYEYVSPKS